MTLRRCLIGTSTGSLVAGAALLSLCGSFSAACQTVNYSYDALGRLVNAAYPDGTCLAYGYDAAGNRTQYTSSTVNGVVAPALTETAYESLALTFDPRAGNPTCGTLTVSSVGSPSHGTATIVSGGAGVMYTPASGYAGSDSFTYKVSSGGVSSPSGTVSITVLAPTLGPTALSTWGSYTGISPAQPIVTNVNPIVSDPYGYSPTVVSVTQGALGSVTYSGNQITYNFSGGPSNKGYYDSYTYTVSDGLGHTATQTIYIKIFIANNKDIVHP